MPESYQRERVWVAFAYAAMSRVDRYAADIRDAYLQSSSSRRTSSFEVHIWPWEHLQGGTNHLRILRRGINRAWFPKPNLIMYEALELHILPSGPRHMNRIREGKWWDGLMRVHPTVHQQWYDVIGENAQHVLRNELGRHFIYYGRRANRIYNDVSEWIREDSTAWQWSQALTF